MPKKPPLYPHIPKSQITSKKKEMAFRPARLLYCKECDKEYATWRGLEGHFKSTGHIGIGSLMINEELLAKMHPEYAVSGFIKEFELVPGDRVRITMPASEPFPAGWAEGIVLTAKHYGERDGWYIEFEKDKVSPGWQKGYGYWKQGLDGGTVVKAEEKKDG